MLRSVLVALALGAVMTEAAYADPSLTATVSPQAAVYPDTKELTYRVEVSTTEETRLTLVASNGAGLWIHPDGGSLEGPGSLIEGPQAWVVPGPPPPGSCYTQTADDWYWRQEFTLDLPADSVSTLVLPMRTGTIRAGRPGEYWFALAGAGPMPRVPVTGAVAPPAFCRPPPCPIFTLAPPRPAGVEQMVIVGQWHVGRPQSRDDYPAVIDFGDGTPPLHTTMNYDCGVGARHTYRSPGMYHLSATVTETKTGRVQHLSRDIEIPEAPPDLPCEGAAQRPGPGQPCVDPRGDRPSLTLDGPPDAGRVRIGRDGWLRLPQRARCDAGPEPCQVEVAVSARLTGKRGKRSLVTLGEADYDAAANTATPLRARIYGAGIRQIRKRGAVRAKVKVVLLHGATTAASTVSVTVKAPPRRRREGGR